MVILMAVSGDFLWLRDRFYAAQLFRFPEPDAGSKG